MLTPHEMGLRIRRARERKRWTQLQLAAEVGASVRAIGSWERGEVVPRNAIGALEELLSIDLTAEGSMEPQAVGR